VEKKVHGSLNYGSMKFSNENAQVSAEKVDESRSMPEIAGQRGRFHRQFIDVRGHCVLRNLV